MLARPLRTEYPFGVGAKQSEPLDEIPAVYRFLAIELRPIVYGPTQQRAQFCRALSRGIAIDCRLDKSSFHDESDLKRCRAQ